MKLGWLWAQSQRLKSKYEKGTVLWEKGRTVNWDTNLQRGILPTLTELFE